MKPRFLLMVLATLIVLVVAVAALLAGCPVFVWAQALDVWVMANVFTAGVLLLVLCTLWSLFLPTMLPTLLGGFWFGMLAGSAVIYTATTAACVLSFLASRHLFHDSAQRWIADSRRVRALQQALVADGWRTILLMRLSPVVPFSVQNWCYGASRIGFWTCLSATLLGKLPNTVLTVAAGALAREGMEAGATGSATSRIGMVLALVATLLLLWSMSKTARRALRDIAEADRMTEDAAAC